MAGKGRPKKVDIPIQTWQQLFDEHIPTGMCTPTELWKVSRITVNSLTSDWPAVKKLTDPGSYPGEDEGRYASACFVSKFVHGVAQEKRAHVEI